MSFPILLCRAARGRVKNVKLQNTSLRSIFIGANYKYPTTRIIQSTDNKSSFSSWRKSSIATRLVKRSFSDLPSHERIMMPNLSPTMETGSIVSWEKEEGDRINEGEVLALIETDKSTMEMETPEEGYLAKIIMPVGSKDIPINRLIAIIVSEEEDIAAFKDYTGEETAPPPPLPSTDPPTNEVKPVSVVTPTVVETPPVASSTNRVFASPLAKRVSLEKGIDINNVVGTGPRGRITVEDVEGHVGQQPKPATTVPVKPSTPPPAGGVAYRDIELSSMRKTIAKRLTESKQNVPHYYLSADVNMDKVFELRQMLNSECVGKCKLSVNDFIIKASALSLKKVPECNSQWMTDVIREFSNVDISVAVSTDGGLITPIVVDADKKGLAEINSDVVALAGQARDKTLQPHQFIGGTFTVSNLGMFGVANFSAVINPPQSCILAVGATQDRVIVDREADSGMKVSKVMDVTLSCDHRVVDGAVGATWLKTFKEYLEKPHTMML